MASNSQPEGPGAEPAQVTSPHQSSTEPPRSSNIHSPSGLTRVQHDENRSPRPLPSPPPFERPPPRSPRSSQPFSPRFRHCKQVIWDLAHMIWLDILVILVVLGITGAVLKWAPLLKQKERRFPVFQDARSGLWKGPHWLSFPLYVAPEDNIVIDKLPNVPRFMVPILPLSVILPVALGFILLIMQIWIRSIWDKIAGLLGLYKTLATISLIQVCLKKFIGEFRPNFITICNPDWDNIINKTRIVVHNQVWGQVSDCQAWIGDQPSPKLTHAMESFPSGHTSECFAAATFLALYLNGKLKPFSDYHTSFWKMVLIISPLFAASFVAGSLLIDHNHHPHDILLSIPIGVFVALLAYRSHYYSLFDYKTNHLYVPFSSSHRSLDKTPQATIDDLSSEYHNSRFRFHDNLAAVAWPRKPQRHEFTANRGQEPELGPGSRLGSGMAPGAPHDGGPLSRTNAVGGHDGAIDMYRGGGRGGMPAGAGADRGRRPLTASSRRPRPARGILKQSSRSQESSEATIPEEDEGAATVVEKGKGKERHGTVGVITVAESSSAAAAAAAAAAAVATVDADATAPTSGSPGTSDDDGSVPKRSGEDRLSASEMV